MALFGLLAGLLVPMLLSLIPLLLVLIGQAKTNNKAGRPGWHVIIPFLCQYTRAAIGGNIKNFWMLLASVGVSSVLGVLGTVLNEVLGQTIALIIALTSLPFGIAAIVFAIKIENGVARAFGKGKGFTAGLIFLPFIFNPILGFSNVGYNGYIPEAPAKTPKEPKPKKEKAAKPAKPPETKKEKSVKGKNTPVIHPEPEEEVEPPRPEFKPQYDMGDTETVEEAPAAPRMTMDEIMLQSLKAKKAPPPPPVEEKPPVVEEKKPEKPSNRFSIAVDYVPEAPKVDVPKADYLIPAFARPDYQPAPPVTEPVAPIVEQPIPQAPASAPTENMEVASTAAEIAPNNEFTQNSEKEIDPFVFFGLPDTMPVSQYQKTPLTEAPIVQPVHTQSPEPVYEQPAPQWTQPEIPQPPIAETYPAVAHPVDEVPQNLFGTIETVAPTPPPDTRVEPIPGFAAIPGFGTPSAPQQPQNTWAPPVMNEQPPVVETPYVAAPITEPTIQPPVDVATYNEPTPATEPVVAPATETIAPVEPEPPVVAPKAPLRFVDPKPVEEKKPVDDDEELPPPPVVPLPPKRGLFSRKPKTIDRFHNEDGGLK